MINLSQKGKKGSGKKPSGDFDGNQNSPRIQKGKKPRIPDARRVPKTKG